MKKITNKGFTLIELLVVVAIIAILALVVLLALNPVEMARRSRDSRRLSDLSTLRKAIDLTLADGTATLKVVNKTTAAATGILDAADAANNLVGMDIIKYIPTIPQDPMYLRAAQVTNGTNCTAPTSTDFTSKAANSMVYSFKSDGLTYELNSFLESKDNCEIVANDGGNAAGVYELGTSLIVL